MKLNVKWKAFVHKLTPSMYTGISEARKHDSPLLVDQKSEKEISNGRFGVDKT